MTSGVIGEILPMNKRDISVIIPAAGRGKRMRSGSGVPIISGRTKTTPKPFILLKGKPILLYIIHIFSRIPGVREVIIAINPNDLMRVKRIFRRTAAGSINIKLVKGGRRRQDSVSNALKVVNPQSRYVLVHDAVRPLVKRDQIIRLIKETRKTGAALLAIPVIDTIKKVNPKTGRVRKTLTPRSEFYLAQTPQGFKKEILQKAYQSRGFRTGLVTDDASLVEALGYPVKIVPGSYTNIKITTPIDLSVASAGITFSK